MAIAGEASSFTQANQAFQSSADLVGSYMGYYGLSSMLMALLLSFYAARHVVNRRLVHAVSLLVGGMGFLGMAWVPDPLWLIACFALVGVAWASILSMPYALLASVIAPEKMGVYMGIFNLFIVIPQIVAATALGPVLRNWFDNQAIYGMLISGASLMVAALFLVRVREPRSAANELLVSH
jgi:maltose/moltooligosaccharide transporter